MFPRSDALSISLTLSHLTDCRYVRSELPCFTKRHKMQKKLEAIEELKLCSETATTVLNETKQYLEEMKDREIMSEEAIASINTSTTAEEIKRALNKRPTVVFIGNRNCGKSAVLNEILGGSYLPVHETPCTSRMVKISYTPGKSTVRVVDKSGQIAKSSITIRKSVPQDYVVVCDEGREKSDQLKCTVEIALNHPFLESGIELIDSPGRNENDALDEVVDDFFEKEATPFVVYIIDGNEHLRSSVSISFAVESINQIYMPVNLE